MVFRTGSGAGVSGRPSNSGLRFLPANRETAFVHAISSAGVMYTLTRNCSLGDFDNCGCDDSRNGQLGEECHGSGWPRPARITERQKRWVGWTRGACLCEYKEKRGEAGGRV